MRHRYNITAKARLDHSLFNSILNRANLTGKLLRLALGYRGSDYWAGNVAGTS